MITAILTLLFIMGVTGVALVFVGWLFTVLMALGNKQYLQGVLCIVFWPIAWYYSAAHWKQDNYCGLLLFGGGALMLLSAGLGAFCYYHWNLKLVPE